VPFAQRPSGPASGAFPETWGPFPQGTGVSGAAYLVTVSYFRGGKFFFVFLSRIKPREMLLTLHVFQKKSPPASALMEEKFPKVAKIFEQCCRHDPAQRPKAVSLLGALRDVNSS